MLTHFIVAFLIGLGLGVIARICFAFVWSLSIFILGYNIGSFGGVKGYISFLADGWKMCLIVNCGLAIGMVLGYIITDALISLVEGL